jgi:ribosomal protein S18 acetylase RimI-like enzyme
MIRPATFADVPGLRRLYGALVAELEASRRIRYPIHDGATLDSFTLLCARRIEDDPAFLCFVARDDDTGALVGFLGGEVAQRVLGDPTVFGAAHWLYVEPAARGQGLAKALVRLGVAELARHGVTHVELAGVAGDDQWARRGWLPYLVHHVLPIAAVAAAAAEPPAALAAPPPPAPPAPVPAPPARVVKVARVRGRKRTRRRRLRAAPPPPPRVAEGGG